MLKLKNETQQRLFWYSKNWYGTTGDVIKDLEIILEDLYLIGNWDVYDVSAIIRNNFEGFIKENTSLFLDKMIFDVYAKGKDINKRFIEVILVMLAFYEVREIEGIDETYKNKFNLRGDLGGIK